MDLFLLKERLENAVPGLRRVEVERYWAFDDEDMPSANIREVRFSPQRQSTSTVRGDFTFVVMLHGITRKEMHEADVKNFIDIRARVVTEVLGFDPSIEIIAGENVGEGAEYTYLGTTLTFMYRRGCIA